MVLCLLPGVGRRSDHSILVAAVTIASALTLNIDPVYVAGDAVLGGRNVLDLCANILMVVGIYFLSRAILRAADPSELPATPDRFGLVVLGLVVVGLITSFSLIDAPRTSAGFMLDYGGQWFAAIYSAVQFVYIGVVVSITGYTCFRFRGDMTRPYFRVAFMLIGVGCALAVVLVLAVLGMDIFHLLGDLDSMRPVSALRRRSDWSHDISVRRAGTPAGRSPHYAKERCENRVRSGQRTHGCLGNDHWHANGGSARFRCK